MQGAHQLLIAKQGTPLAFRDERSTPASHVSGRSGPPRAAAHRRLQSGLLGGAIPGHVTEANTAAALEP